MAHRRVRLLSIGLAASRAAGLDAGTPLGRDALARQVAALRGLPQKLAQLLALGDAAQAPVDAPLPEIEATLEGAAARRLVEARLGGPMSQWFASFDERGLGASLSQVHRATLHDGREVAVKLQRPGIAEAAQRDLQAPALMSAPFGDWRRGFDAATYRSELSRRLEQELDYRLEAASLRAFSEASLPLGVTVPRVVDPLVSRDVLVMDWCGGEPFAAVRGWPLEERRALARTLVRFLLGSIFEVGRVHADPHPGNFRFTRDAAGPRVAVLDFGSVLTLESRARRALIHLVAARLGALALTPEDATSLWVELGFDAHMLEPIAVKLPRVADVLFAPFASTAPFDVSAWDPSAELDALLGEEKWTLRFAGPPALLLLLRAFRGLLAYLDALDAPIAWRPLVVEALNRATPAARPTPRPPAAPSMVAGVAHALRIRVSEGDETKLELRFRAQVTPALRELVPDEVSALLERGAVDLDAIARRAVAGGLQRGALFEGGEGPTHVRIWLE